MDTAAERAIVVNIQDEKCIKFKEWNDGLYYFDTKKNKLEDAPSVNSYSGIGKRYWWYYYKV